MKGNEAGMKANKGNGPNSGSPTSAASAAKSTSKPATASADPGKQIKSRLEGEDLLARCERAVELALARGADEAECFWESGASVGVELQNGRLASTSADAGQGASIRLISQKRVGFAYCTKEEDLAATIDRALANSRHGEVGYSLPDAAKVGGLQKWDARIAPLDVQVVMDLARGLLAGAKETAPSATFAGGGVGMDSDQWALASSQGAGAWDRSTHVGASASLVLADGERSVSASEMKTSHRLDLDSSWVGAEAGRTTMSLRAPQKVKRGGKRDVLFRPEAALDLILGPAVGAAMGDEAKRGKSFWSDKLGKPVTSSHLTIADNPLHPDAIGGCSFDDEGLAAQLVPIVEDGVLRSYIFDSWDAHRHKEASTHSAVRDGFKSRPTAGTHHLTVGSRTARPFDRVMAGIDDGFLVESVLGAHTANATTGDFSVTSPNVWRIRKGAIVGAVTEIAISGRLPEVLQRIRVVASEPKSMDGARVPAIVVEDLDISV